jgi:ubiquitin-activating enzyme E1
VLKLVRNLYLSNFINYESFSKFFFLTSYLRYYSLLVAKNLILAGPRSVTLFDPEPVSVADVGTNYFLPISSVGKPRAATCVAQLAELNSYVQVSVLPESSISPAVLSRFQVVVATSTPRSQLVVWNSFCHAQSPAIAFIAADVFGAAGFAFSDFGPSFVVRDPSGEANKSATVVGIVKGGSGKNLFIQCHDAKRHGFEDGNHVIFREVEGISKLNDGVPRKITNCKAHSFELVDEDGSSLGEYITGGIVEQFKVPQTVSFAPLSDRIDCPVHPEEGMLITPDLGKWGRSEQLHAAFQAVELYRARHGGKLPPLRDLAAAEECVTLAKEWTASLVNKEGALSLRPEDISGDVVSRVAALSSAELPALCAFFGGVVAQEVVKFTGKYMPLRQWLYLDAFEVLPEDIAVTLDTPMSTSSSSAPEKIVASTMFGTLQPMSAEFAPVGTRYDNLIAILGKTLQTKVMSQNIFLVGAGALGCEMLKNFALMGVGCGSAGKVTVTDGDRIEVSNLNRQFLFRPNNVGQPKSKTAAAAAVAMNPDLKVEALETLVGDDTENIFTDAFWSSLDIITNALDNVKARTYNDGRAVLFQKPLMESGTLGTKANTQVVLPFMTETYSESQDPPEDSIPMCTLRHYPHLIEHCIEWARDLFHGSFNATVIEADKFVKNPEVWISKANEENNLAMRRGLLESTLTYIAAGKDMTLSNCVAFARSLFHSEFYLKIKQLLHNFPADYADPTTGAKFWSGTKRTPSAANFDLNDETHRAFIVFGTKLAAENYGLKLPNGWDSTASLAAELAKIPVPEFRPTNVRIKANEKDTVVEGGEDDGPFCDAAVAKLRQLASSLGPDGLKNLKFTPAEFEKDDDSNGHIDFITAASNLRARNYSIREATRFDVKMTAGKIIPAVGTTTCSITGLVCIELYKVIAKVKVESFRNSFLNLGTNVYSMGEPAGPKRTKSKAYDPISMGPVRAYPEGFSRWDHLEIRGGASMTCKQLGDWFQSKHNLSLSMLTQGKNILYNPDLFKSHREERSKMSIVDVLKMVSKSEIQPGKAFLLLDVSLSDDAGDVLVPQIKFYIQ